MGDTAVNRTPLFSVPPPWQSHPSLWLPAILDYILWNHKPRLNTSPLSCLCQAFYQSWEKPMHCKWLLLCLVWGVWIRGKEPCVCSLRNVPCGYNHFVCVHHVSVCVCHVYYGHIPNRLTLAPCIYFWSTVDWFHKCGTHRYGGSMTVTMCIT